MREGNARRAVLFALGGVLSWALAGCATIPGEVSGLDRSIWVTRWDYRTREDIRDIMANCAEAGFTAVMFQVRGNGTVFYRSELEPWSEAFDFRHPGFDPLAVLALTTTERQARKAAQRAAEEDEDEAVARMFEND